MNRKMIVMSLILAVLSTAGYAESVENSSPPHGKNESALDGGASFFEGAWVGEWEIVGQKMGNPRRQDITIVIEKKNEEGFHKTTYSWGWVGNNPPGSRTAYGKEQDGAFTFWWKNMEGNKRTVKLEKYKDDVVKARIETDGPAVKQRPFFDGYLKRN